MGKTSIEWTDFSVNPIRARFNGRVGHHCVKISPGCTNCYASAMQKRFGLPPFEVGKREGVVSFFDDAQLEQVLRRRTPSRWFWCDMSDLFGEWVPDDWIDRCLAVMALSGAWPRHFGVAGHTHQVLTKRPERAREYLSAYDRADRVANAIEQVVGDFDGYHVRGSWPASVVDALTHGAWPIESLWLGTSTENQARADERIPELLQTPARVRWISAEPLLNEIDVQPYVGAWHCCAVCGWVPVEGMTRYLEIHGEGAECITCKLPLRRRLDWVVVGGESGPGARVCHEAWVHEIVDRCRAASVPCFVKQLGKNVLTYGSVGYDWPSGTRIHCGNGMQQPGRAQLRDRKGGKMDEWPEYLRVREYPR